MRAALRRAPALPQAMPALGMCKGASSNMLSCNSLGMLPQASPAAGHVPFAQRRAAATDAGSALTQALLDALLVDAGHLARKAPEDLTTQDICEAVSLHNRLPHDSSPSVSAIAQQVIRTLLSYRGWLLPTSWRNDLATGPEKWHASLPAPSGDGQLLPLAMDTNALSQLKFRTAPGAGIEPLVVVGYEAVLEYIQEGNSRDLIGLAFNPAHEGELVLGGEEHLPLLRSWGAAMQAEALLETMLEEYKKGPLGGEVPPASPELTRALLDAPLAVVRNMDNTNLAVDNTGKNFIVLTCPDAAALCAQRFGRNKVRSCDAEELRNMASEASREFGFAVTFGPNLVMGDADPGWRSLAVTAEWLAVALTPP